jgi:hypothetical protein
MRGPVASALHILGVLMIAFGAWRIYVAIASHGEQWKVGAIFIILGLGVFGGIASLKRNAQNNDRTK